MVKAHIVMAYVVMAYIVMAYTVMAYVVMAYIVMAYTVMARMVTAYTDTEIFTGRRFALLRVWCVHVEVVPWKLGNMIPSDSLLALQCRKPGCGYLFLMKLGGSNKTKERCGVPSPSIPP